jgi:hypothetical protein
MALSIHRPLDQLGADWQVLSRAPEAAAAILALAAAEPEIAALGVRDAGELLDTLHRAGTQAEREHSAAIFRAMLRSLDVHPFVARAALQALVPGLVGVARRLGWGRGGEWEDTSSFVADLLATTWEVVIDWAGQDRPYAAMDVLSAVRCRMRRQILRHRADVDLHSEQLREEDLKVSPNFNTLSDLDHLAAFLDDMAGRGLARADTAVIYGTRVLGLTMKEMAALSGRTRRQLDSHRKRAERALCA